MKKALSLLLCAALLAASLPLPDLAWAQARTQGISEGLDVGNSGLAGARSRSVANLNLNISLSGSGLSGLQGTFSGGTRDLSFLRAQTNTLQAQGLSAQAVAPRTPQTAAFTASNVQGLPLALPAPGPAVWQIQAAYAPPADIPFQRQRRGMNVFSGLTRFADLLIPAKGARPAIQAEQLPVTWDNAALKAQKDFSVAAAAGQAIRRPNLSYPSVQSRTAKPEPASVQVPAANGRQPSSRYQRAASLLLVALGTAWTLLSAPQAAQAGTGGFLPSADSGPGWTLVGLASFAAAALWIKTALFLKNHGLSKGKFLLFAVPAAALTVLAAPSLISLAAAITLPSLGWGWAAVGLGAVALLQAARRLKKGLNDRKTALIGLAALTLVAAPFLAPLLPAVSMALDSIAMGPGGWALAGLGAAGLLQTLRRLKKGLNDRKTALIGLSALALLAASPFISPLLASLSLPNLGSPAAPGGPAAWMLSGAASLFALRTVFAARAKNRLALAWGTLLAAALPAVYFAETIAAFVSPTTVLVLILYAELSALMASRIKMPGAAPKKKSGPVIMSLLIMGALTWFMSPRVAPNEAAVVTRFGQTQEQVVRNNLLGRYLTLTMFPVSLMENVSTYNLDPQENSGKLSFDVSGRNITTEDAFDPGKKLLITDILSSDRVKWRVEPEQLRALREQGATTNEEIYQKFIVPLMQKRLEAAVRKMAADGQHLSEMQLAQLAYKLPAILDDPEYTENGEKKGRLRDEVWNTPGIEHAIDITEIHMGGGNKTRPLP